MKTRSRRLLTFLAFGLSLGLSAPASHALVYTAHLTGPNESPPVASPGIGDGTVNFDLSTHTLSVAMTFSGLTSGTTASHIHCCVATPGIGTASVATQLPTFVGFPLGVTSGSYSNTFNTLSAGTWNPAFITANGGTPASAEAALAAGLSAGTSYLNIHTSNFTNGEIRGFLTASTTGQVPEPADLALFGIAAVGLLAARRRYS
jgi:hypothetical protein